MSVADNFIKLYLDIHLNKASVMQKGTFQHNK